MGVHYFCHSVCLFFIFIQCKRYNFLALLPPPHLPTHIVRHLEVLGICGEILTFIIMMMMMMDDCMHKTKQNKKHYIICKDSQHKDMIGQWDSPNNKPNDVVSFTLHGIVFNVLLLLFLLLL